MLGPRKNNEVLALALTEDVVDAIRWHIQLGYAGPEFLIEVSGLCEIEGLGLPAHYGHPPANRSWVSKY